MPWLVITLKITSGIKILRRMTYPRQLLNNTCLKERIWKVRGIIAAINGHRLCNFRFTNRYNAFKTSMKPQISATGFCKPEIYKIELMFAPA